MHRPLAGLTRKNLAREALAGVTLMAIAVPLNIGYAQIAGLPATAGLYALIVPTVVYALLASSRQLVASPDAAAAALVASSLGGLAVAGTADYAALALGQAMIVGTILVVFAALRWGFLATFLSSPILVGFLSGLALDIMVGQIAKMVGIALVPGESFASKVVSLLAGLPRASTWSVGIAVASLIILLLGRRYAAGVPWALIVIVLAAAGVAAAGLNGEGVDTLGHVQAGAPEFVWPMLSASTWLSLVPSSVALALVICAQGLLVSRTYSAKRGYAFHADRDLLALGAANIAAGVQGSFVMGASTSRTAAMDQAGSRTQLPSLVLAGGSLLLLLFGAGLLSVIPASAVGAVIAVAILPLFGTRAYASLWRRDRFEFAVALACALVTVVAGAVWGIGIAFVLALINLARRAANPPIEILRGSDDPDESLLEEARPGTPTVPGILVIRLSAPLFFANGTAFADAITSAVRAVGPDSVLDVVLDMEGITDIDVTGADALASAVRWLEASGIAVCFSRVRTPILDRATILGLRGDRRVFATNRAAIAALRR